MVPSYISRSVAGSFDNEGVAIFALVNVFWLFIKVRLTSCARDANDDRGPHPAPTHHNPMVASTPMQTTSCALQKGLDRICQTAGRYSVSHSTCGMPCPADCEHGVHTLGHMARLGLLLHGHVLGRLLVHHQPAAHLLPSVYLHRQTQHQTVCGFRATGGHWHAWVRYASTRPQAGSTGQTRCRLQACVYSTQCECMSVYLSESARVCVCVS